MTINLSLALPSNLTFSEKDYLVSIANKLGFGIYLSDLPTNHDLFQLLSLWQSKYLNLRSLGTAIISPLTYDLRQLIKQVNSIFEINTTKIIIGFGVGDKKFISADIDKPFREFKSRIESIVGQIRLNQVSSNIALAGSGKNLLRYVNDLGLGLIFNGIPDKIIVESFENSSTKSNISAFIMAEFNEYHLLSSNFISITARIIAGLSKSEKTRLKITDEQTDLIQHNLKNKDKNKIETWLPESLIKKVAIIGSISEFKEFIQKMNLLNIKEVILSIPNKENRTKFLEYSLS